jgi:hypothetical protein
MDPINASLTVDDFEEDLVEMANNQSTREEMLTWLPKQGVETSLRTLNRRLTAWQANRRTWTHTKSDKDRLTKIIDHLFHHHHTFSDYQIAQRIKEDHEIDTTARHVKEIRLENGWLRRNDDLESAKAQEASTFNLIQELFSDGHIRQYGRRQLIAHLSHKHGHRPRGNDVRKALQVLDNYGVTSRVPGMKKKRQENYTVPGPDWLWCLDGHDKLARYGFEIYGSVDAYSRKIVWFFVGCSNRTQVSVLRQYLNTVKKLGYCPNFLRTDRGRETPMMADAHYYFYHTACFYDTTIPDDVFDQICFADCYIYGTSTRNVKIESLWGQMIQRKTSQWMLLFRAIEIAGWFREDLPTDQIILLFIFMPLLRSELFDWVEDHNALPIRPQRERSQHVAGVPNDLYRGSVDAVKQGFDFDLDLHAELEATVLAYGKYPVYT